MCVYEDVASAWEVEGSGECVCNCGCRGTCAHISRVHTPCMSCGKSEEFVQGVSYLCSLCLSFCHTHDVASLILQNI